MIEEVKTDKRSLDVGCGFRPQGDVNVDISRSKWNPQTNVREELRNIKLIPNFVQADGQFLPFRDKIFETVLSRETIEHVDNPFLFLSELIRVSKNEVMLTTPHRFCPRMNPFHKYHFTKTWFVKALRKLGIPRDNFRIRIIGYIHLPYEYLPIVRLPRNILVEVRKKKPFWKEIIYEEVL